MFYPSHMNKIPVWHKVLLLLSIYMPPFLWSRPHPKQQTTFSRGFIAHTHNFCPTGRRIRHVILFAIRWRTPGPLLAFYLHPGLMEIFDTPLVKHLPPFSQSNLVTKREPNGWGPLSPPKTANLTPPLKKQTLKWSPSLSLNSYHLSA